MIDSEVGATRLLAEAEIRAAQWTNESFDKPRELIEAMLLQISCSTSEHLSAAANESVITIKRDAELAIENLKRAGASAIVEIQELALRVETQLNSDAKKAEEKLRTFRERPHTSEEAETEADQACRLVLQAADEGTSVLRDALNRSFETINKITDDACVVVQEAALAAEKRLSQGLVQALIRLDEVIELSRKSEK